MFTRYQVKCCFFPDTEFICLSCFRQCLGNAVWGSDQGFGIQVTYFYQELYNNILSERQTQQSNNLFGRISKNIISDFSQGICEIHFFLLIYVICTIYTAFGKYQRKVKTFIRNYRYDIIHVHMI